MLTGNKGAWSELYVLFKVLGDTRLYVGDAQLHRLEELFYPVVKIIREESQGDVCYQLNGDIVLVNDSGVEVSMTINDFSTQAAKLLQEIKAATGSAFSIPEIEQFMLSVGCRAIAANSSSKSDIRIVIHDTRVNQVAELGFSIKSQIGGDSTLFNPNKRKTNFVFKVNGVNIDERDIERINQINTRTGKIKNRIQAIFQLGGALIFHKMEGEVFNNNLVLIDSLLPQIFSEVIKEYFTTDFSSISELAQLIRERNPLGFDMQHGHDFYEYKIKHFLTDSALGMTGSRVWSGVYDVTGGYLIVKSDGDVLCYHVYNRNEFENYLFFNTKLDTPSSSRHEFGTLYKENGQLYFALNLQIRFK